MTLEELQVVIEAQTSQFKSEIGKIQNQVKSATSNITRETDKIKGIFSSLGKFIGTLAIGKVFVDSVKSAMKVEGAIQQINRTMGESSNAFLKWGKDHGLAFNLAQSDIANYGAVYSNLLSGFMGSSSATMKGTQDLLKASSIIASGTGRTMTDVQERIRSGLLGNTEAIEDLGINVNVAMLESTDAFKRFAGNKSWNQLSFQTQQQIRLFSILEQTTSKFGTSVMQNASSSWQGFIAILKDVQLNLGQAFLPIMNVVMPLLSSLAMGLRTVTAYFAVFMQTLFGKPMQTPSIASTMDTAKSSAIGATGAQNGYADSIGKTGDAAKKTAKEMKGILGGFDEINSLSNSGADGGDALGGGLGGYGDIPSLDLGLDKEPDTSGASKLAEKIKKIVSEITGFIQKHKVIIISIVSGIVAGIAAFFVISNWGFIAGLVASIISWISLIPTALGVAFLTVTSPAVLIAAAIGAVVAAIVYLWQTSEEFRGIITGIIDDVMGLLSRLWNEILKPLFSFIADVFVSILVPLATFIGTVIVDVVMAVFRVIKSLWDNILAPIATFLIDILAVALKGIIDIWTAWKPAIDVVFNAIMWLWNNALKPIVDFIVYMLCGALDLVGQRVKDMCSIMMRIFTGLVDFVVGVFTGDWSRAWQGIQNIFGGVFEGMVWLAKAPLNAIIDLINWAIGGINDALTMEVPDWVPLIGGSGWSVNIPKIPKLAKGGIVDSAQMFIAGEAGKEAVMPLENNTGWITDLAQKVYSRMPGSSAGNNTPINLTLQFSVGTMKFAKTICTSLNELGKNNGGVIPINI